MGTPHRGSAVASVGEVAALIASCLVMELDYGTVRSLESGSEVIENIHDDFMKMVMTGDFHVHSFQETMPMSFLHQLVSILIFINSEERIIHTKQVVESYSSKTGYALEGVELIDADHFQMTKF